MSIDTPPTSADELIEAAKGMGDNEIQALVARLVIDSLGRPWDPLKHPRDSEGKFIETFAEVRGLFRTEGGAKGDPKITGKVVAFNRDGGVQVRVDHVADGYTAHKVGDIVSIKPDDLVAMDAKAKINRPLDDGQRAKLNDLANGLEGVDPDAAAALRRAADPSNTEMIAQLADLREARQLLDDNSDTDASPAARDAVWDMLDQLGDLPSNDEVLRAAKHMVRDNLARTPGNEDAIARIDADINAEAPAPRPAQPNEVDQLAAALYKRADVLQGRFPADADALRNVADALGDAAVSDIGPEQRDTLLERALTRASKIKNAELRKTLIAKLKNIRENPAEPQAADAPDRKASLPAPSPADPLPTPQVPDAPAAQGISEDDKNYFLMNGAPELARALQEKLGWDIAVITDGMGPGEGGQEGWIHAFALSPEDMAVEVNGLIDPGELLDRWAMEWHGQDDVDTANMDVVIVPKDDYEKWGISKGEDPARASKVADQLIADLDLKAAEPDAAEPGPSIPPRIKGETPQPNPRGVPYTEPGPSIPPQVQDAVPPLPDLGERPTAWQAAPEEPGVWFEPGTRFVKGPYLARIFDNRIVVGKYDDNGRVLWESQAGDWASVDRDVEAYEAMKKAGEIPAAERGRMVETLRALGFSDGTADQFYFAPAKDLRKIMEGDPRYSEMEAAYQDAAGADAWHPEQRKAFEDWGKLQSGVMAKLKAPGLAPASPAPDSPESPEVPAYSGEIREPQLRDLAEIYRAADAAKNWIELTDEFLVDNKGEGQNDPAFVAEVGQAWGALDAAVRNRDFAEAQNQLAVIKDAVAAPNVLPNVREDMQAYIDQVQGALDKVQQRQNGQFEIPGVAPASPIGRIEQDAPEINAAFADLLETNPDANARFKALLVHLRALRVDVDDDQVRRPLDDAMEALNNEDFVRGFDILDAAVRERPDRAPTQDGETDQGLEYYGPVIPLRRALADVAGDWEAMIEGNPDLAKYLPNADTPAPAPESPVGPENELPVVRDMIDYYDGAGSAVDDAIVRAIQAFKDGVEPAPDDLRALKDDVLNRYANGPSDAAPRFGEMMRYLDVRIPTGPPPIPGDEPLAPWEQDLLDPNGPPDAAADKAKMLWGNIVAEMDAQLGDAGGIGEVYNAVIADQDLTDPALIQAALGDVRDALVRDNDEPALDIFDRILAENGVGPESDVPGPVDPTASPEAVIPDPPKGGSPVKDERRVLDARVRGEIEAVGRGVGIPELPDRIDLDKNGVVVFPLDLVDVPAAGMQGRANNRRPAGIGQVRRIYTKNGVRYAEVAFYDPKFVDYPNQNKVKALAGIKNNEPFYRWDGIRLDKVQKVDGDNPDAVEFLGNLGPEEARQYAGRNAGRLAQNRGRVRPELERMANLQYIGDRYVGDADGLPVGKGDVVVYKGKKYEIVRVDNDNPGVGNNVRLDLVPLGVDGAPELQAGGKHAQPYARMVKFYDQPLGDRQPGVTLDELKDIVRRLDGGGKYDVGDALRAALEGNDLKEVARAFNEDPAILDYIADGRAYIQDYVRRLLQANVRGNYDEVRRNEPEMVRKDKNDLLNVMAAVDGRFLEGTGADRHIVRQIPAAGPDAEYKGGRPEVIMPLRYVEAKKAVQEIIADKPGDPMWPEVLANLEHAGKVNLDNSDAFGQAYREVAYVRQLAENNGEPTLQQAADNLLRAMGEWQDEQLKRRAIRQGGPGNEAKLPQGRTVAPGLVREPGLSKDPNAPAADAGAQDKAYEVKLAADENALNNYRDLVNYLAAVRKDAEIGGGAGDLVDYLVGLRKNIVDRKYGLAYHKVDKLLAVPQDDPDAEKLNAWQDYLVDGGYDTGLRDLLRAVKADYGDLPATEDYAPKAEPARAFQGRKKIPVNRPAAPAAPEPAAPAAQDAPGRAMPADMADDLLVKNVIGLNGKRAVRDLRAGNAPDPADLDALREDVQKRIDYYGRRGGNQPRADFYQGVKDYLDGMNAPVGPQNPEEAVKAIDAAIEARYDELRADRKNNAARRAAADLQDQGDEIMGKLNGAMAYDDGDPDNADTRDTMFADVQKGIDGLRDIDPQVADAVQEHFDALRDLIKRRDAQQLMERYFDEAAKAHDGEPPNNDQRDRMLRAIEDQIGMLQTEYPDMVAEMQAKLDKIRAQYAADDEERAKAKPVGRTEALDNFDAQVEAERKRLRGEGDATAAREIVRLADEIAGPINDAEDAHKAGDIAERDAALDRARAALPDLEAKSPDLAEQARQAIEGNAARFARADATPTFAAGPIEVEPGKSHTRLDIPASREAGDVEGAAQAFLGLSNDELSQMAKGRIPTPDGYKVRYLGGGAVGGAHLVTHTATGHKYILKSDNVSPLGLEAEEDVSILYRALGLPQPKVYRLRANNDGRDVVIMDFAGLDQELTNVQEYLDAGLNQPSLATLNLLDPDDALRFVLANAIIGQTDRHYRNIMIGDTPTGHRSPVFIDNGLALFNGGHRNTNGKDRENKNTPWAYNPMQVLFRAEGANTVSWNKNQNLKAALQRAAALSDGALRETLTQWAERMRDEAAKRANEFRNDATATFVARRAQWVIDNIDEVVEAFNTGSWKGYK